MRDAANKVLRSAGTIPSAWSALPLTFLDVSDNAAVGACSCAGSAQAPFLWTILQ